MSTPQQDSLTYMEKWIYVFFSIEISLMLTERIRLTSKILKFNLIFCEHQIIWRAHYNLHRKSISVNILDSFRVSKRNETFFTELSRNSWFHSLSLPFSPFFFFGGGTTCCSCKPHFILAVVHTATIIGNQNGHRFCWVHKVNFFCVSCLTTWFLWLTLAIFIKFVKVTDGLWVLLSQETTVMLSSAVHGVVGLLRIANWSFWRFLRYWQLPCLPWINRTS